MHTFWFLVGGWLFDFASEACMGKERTGKYGAYILNYLVSEVKDVHIYIFIDTYITVCMYKCI